MLPSTVNIFKALQWLRRMSGQCDICKEKDSYTKPVLHLTRNLELDDCPSKENLLG